MQPRMHASERPPARAAMRAIWYVEMRPFVIKISQHQIIDISTIRTKVNVSQMRLGMKGMAS